MIRGEDVVCQIFWLKNDISAEQCATGLQTDPNAAKKIRSGCAVRSRASTSQAKGGYVTAAN